MLRSFRVANHRSIRDEAELLLMPAYDKSRPVVPVAAIFGANASGKSNLLDALRWMQTAVRTSYAAWEPGAGVPRTPFRLDPKATKERSNYMIEILVDSIRYTYGFSVDDERVLEEWLYAYPHSRRRVIFERTGTDIRLGSTVTEQRTRGDVLAGLTRSNSLFLSVAARSDQDEVQPVYQWFRTGVSFVQSAQPTINSALVARLAEGSSERDSLVSLIRAADLGISDVLVDDEARESSGGPVEFRIPGVRGRPVERGDRTQTQPVVAKRSPKPLALSGVLRLSPSPPLVFYHGTSQVPLTVAEQSAGTRAWVSMVSEALTALEDGSLLVVDEIDASLHPSLTARLIELFRDTEINSRGAQLVVTTHDSALLGPMIGEDALARDEIWFVEKERDSGASRIFPLTDFHPRKDENTERRYLAGSYGAVPMVSEHEFREALRREGRDAAA